DIPWNPAVLEQRIARIYRIGQKKKVNIINLIANGTIEHKMLDVLSFKTSMAEGVLDGGDDTIMLQEDRFKKFMQSVETMVDDPAPEPVAADEPEESEDINSTYQKAAGTSENLGFDGKQMGLFDDKDPEKSPSQPPLPQREPQPQKNDGANTDWLKQMAAAFANPQMANQLAKTFTEKNHQTGETYFKIPVENEKVVENVLNSLGQLFKAMDLGKGKD
ncbi:MAG: ATP-dependent helicase, partial [Cyclobacteriaceae bacterium]